MPKNENNDESENDGEQFYGISGDPDILEKLLRAIVKANTFGEESETTRVNKAMHALVGKGVSKYAVTSDSDFESLRYMGALQHRDECFRDMHRITHYKNPDPPEAPKVRKPHALAYEAAKNFAPSTYDEDDIIRTANRLREKFNGTYHKGSMNRPKINSSMTYKYMAVEHDDVVDSQEAQSLESICAELAKHGIKTKLNE
ncbi:hypothetical protein ACOTTU_13175 [Roseobacter sp. EG26]|uniref:hypothetical protein n=1 Tax=Roseobacter sp. EG26 TaxID=3412477 RepID=UPI003CE4F5AA